MTFELRTTGPLAFGFQRATHTHNGVDVPAPLGQPLFAVADGAIEHAHREPAAGFSGYGRVVVLRADSDGTHHLYAHLDRLANAMAPGALVRKGELIGYVGKTAFENGDPASMTSGPHVHYEVSPTPYPQSNTRPRLDPVAWLGANAAHPLGDGMNLYRESGLSYGTQGLDSGFHRAAALAGAVTTAVALALAFHRWRARRRAA